ncbi:MAG: glutathione S-transferase family protein [Polaromonas sp.]|uniref:glutathione S-transferase family protein n=1 Tax=Polaromonas sp. TaxID=1869339 RepID=UPI002731CCCB|nr:glutathione S-transferase family protein [Polaromonas sp.]MDP2256856.1 glutathione S-transferase family protein [Polaromonas sp.]MDP3709083.1 glutathione S-transferase family protein [Polaromonas sp.]
MALKIYGTAASRAARPLWVAEELGLDYEHMDLPYLGGATRTPEFLALNPNGRIPVVDDDGVLVWESMACALYLAERFKGGGLSLAAETPAELADILRWSFWVVNECEKDALTYLMHSALMPPERRKPQLADEAQRRLLTPLRVLEQHLQTRRYLAGERFTVADVCVASVMAWVQGASALMVQSPRVGEWLQHCLARPAFQTVQLMIKSE